MEEMLYTERITHKEEYTRGKRSTHNGVYIWRSVHMEDYTHERVYIWRSVHMEEYTHGSVYIQEEE